MLGLTEAQKIAIYNWLHTETGANVIFAGQRNNRPNKDLVVVNVTAPPKTDAMGPDKQRDGSIYVKNKFHKSFTLSIAVLARKDSGCIVGLVEDSVFKKSVKDTLAAAGLYCRHCLGSTNTTGELIDRLEYMSTIDFRFGVTSNFIEERDIIEDVEIEYDNS